ncbi:30S ribosomal protein S12 methylthiotransferase RimO [Desulfobacterium sp. N47]
MQRHIKNIYLESLGCARNLVDSELMLGRLADAGFNIVSDPAKARTILINTCSFIEAAISESVDTILELAKYKRNGKCRRIIVTGCLPERFREKIIKTLPEVDFFLGTGAYSKILQAVEGIPIASGILLPDPGLTTLSYNAETRIRTDPNIAYLKISEGCSRRCTYCIIPKLRGKQRSREIEDVVLEAKSLIESGVKELILVAQDTSYYGKDMGSSVSLAKLIERISGLSDDIWIRILYGHPESIETDAIKAIACTHNVCPYFDIPIQHVNSKILKRMGRNYNQTKLLKLFDKIRSYDSDAVLRTTVITGFPGETDKDFAELLSFIETVKFDHLGTFIYSDSKDIASHNLSEKVRKNVAKKRYDRIMSSQMEISYHKNRRHIGKVFDVLVEGFPEEKLYIGRTKYQAPDVDGITYISGELKTGSLVRTKITDALEYDLIGEPA